jgi:hypothetical protein
MSEGEDRAQASGRRSRPRGRDFATSINTSLTSVRSEADCVGVCPGRVGAGRTAERCFPTPLSEPDVPVSEHPALQGLASSRIAVIGFLSAERPGSPGSMRNPPNALQLFVHRTSIPWPPSPGTRRSRAPSPMEPPTLAWFLGGRLTSASQPPTFMVMDSTSVFRWCLLGNPSRSSRYPDRAEGRSGGLCHPVGWPIGFASLGHPSEDNVPLDAVAAPSILGSVAQATPAMTWQGADFPEVVRHCVASPCTL